MVEVKEKKTGEGNIYIFKRIASHNPPMYDGASDPKAFKDWI